MIIGTAGHIDHGKTSLVKALTGVDTDVLKEEKERGITVDLGFAYAPTAHGEVLGYVDVPGHERLVRNMLAGATGIDHVLLLVAADDGPMPQTREHLSILHLLGLTQGTVVLSKCDLVSTERLAQAELEVKAILAPTGLANAPIMAVSSRTGQGVAALLERLHGLAQNAPPPHQAGQFRLSVDRSFSLPGVGTVVTGTATHGAVKIGDILLISPSGNEVRVRGIHAHNCKSETGQAGQRLALNLAGIDKAEVQRGDWVVTRTLHAPTQRINARLHWLASEEKPLLHWLPVHLHSGAGDVLARVALLQGPSLLPGQSAYVQFELDRPIAVLRGDRLIVRDQSATRTLGGGEVIDIFAPVSRRHKTQRCAVLKALEHSSPQAALQALLDLHHATGVDMAQFATLWNFSETDLAALQNQVPHQLLTALSTSARDLAGRELAFSPAFLADTLQRVQDVLGRYHSKNPDSPGLAVEQLQRNIRERPAAGLFSAWLEILVKDGALKRSGPHYALPTHSVSLQGAEKIIWERIKPMLDEGGIHPPRLDDILLRDRSLRKEAVLRTLQRLERMGKLRAVGNDYFIQQGHLLQLALAAQKLAKNDANQRLNVKELRETTGISRHLTLPLVEFFDAIGLTQRDEVGRHFRRDPKAMFIG